MDGFFYARVGAVLAIAGARDYVGRELFMASFVIFSFPDQCGLKGFTKSRYLRAVRQALVDWRQTLSENFREWILETEIQPITAENAREGHVVYLLLCGGNKSTQRADIKRTVAMWSTIRKERS